MKRMFLIVLTVLLSIAFVSPASAADVYKFQFRGQYLSATFYTADDCSYTYTSVYAAENAYRLEGRPESGPMIAVYLSGYNFCTGLDIYGNGFAIPESFTAKKGKASVQGQVLVYDFIGGGETEFSVNLDATGYGTHERFNDVYQEQLPDGTHYVTHNNSSWQWATATGSIVGGGVEYAVQAMGSQIGRSAYSAVYIY